jgi:hypothetical protein
MSRILYPTGTIGSTGNEKVYSFLYRPSYDLNNIVLETLAHGSCDHVVWVHFASIREPQDSRKKWRLRTQNCNFYFSSTAQALCMHRAEEV